MILENVTYRHIQMQQIRNTKLGIYSFLVIFWPLSFFKLLKELQQKNVQQRNLLWIAFQALIVLSAVLNAFIFVLWSMEKMPFGPIGFFSLQYLKMPLGKCIAILPVQHSHLIIEPRTQWEIFPLYIPQHRPVSVFCAFLKLLRSRSAEMDSFPAAVPSGCLKPRSAADVASVSRENWAAAKRALTHAPDSFHSAQILNK